MPQIPTLPIDEPVALPKAKPALFGAVGETIAGLGYETEQMAQQNVAFEGYLLGAQRQLRAKQAQIAFEKRKLQVYDELRKATTPEEAQQIYERSKGELDGIIAPFETDRVLSRQLGIYRQQEDVEIQGTVNAKKADIVTKSDHAANAVLGEKSLQTAINTKIGGGDPSIAREQYNLQLQSSVAHGTMLPDQAEGAMIQWDQDYQKGLIEAYMNSPDPTIRKQNISDLKSGKGEYSQLDQATINALLTKSESRHRELTNLAESEDYNGAVNHLSDLTKGWSYEDKVKALQDGEWLKHNGFVTADGQADRKKADMLLEEVDREETRRHKVQTDRDNDIISKHSDDADTRKLTAPQIDQIVKQEGGSPRAASTLRSILRQSVRDARAEYRFERSLERGAEADERRSARENGDKIAADIFQRMIKGETIDPLKDIWDHVEAGDMTVNQATKLSGKVKAVKGADFDFNLKRIQNAPGLDKQTQGRLGLELLDAVNQKNLQGNEMKAFTDNLLQESGKKATSNFIERMWNNIQHGPVSGGATTTTAPSTKPSAPSKIYARDPQGQLHEAAPGTTLPPGWKLEGK